MPGAGKTSVGTALAQLLQWGFVDTDDLVGDPASIIERDGIDAFRAREREVIAAVQPRDRVVAVGGGAVLDPANRAVLSSLGPIVWLRADAGTLTAHLAGDDRDRPLLHDHGALRYLLAERTPIYADFADVVVDVDGLDPNQVAVEVVKALAA